MSQVGLLALQGMSSSRGAFSQQSNTNTNVKGIEIQGNTNKMPRDRSTGQHKYKLQKDRNTEQHKYNFQKDTNTGRAAQRQMSARPE